VRGRMPPERRRPSAVRTSPFWRWVGELPGELAALIDAARSGRNIWSKKATRYRAAALSSIADKPPNPRLRLSESTIGFKSADRNLRRRGWRRPHGEFEFAVQIELTKKRQ